MTADTAVIAEAQAAWRRLRRGQSFDLWIKIGLALRIARTECMLAAGSNVPFGSRYNRLMGEWLERHKLDLTGQERYGVLQVVDRLTEIQMWRETLTDKQRRKWNSPSAVLAQLKRAKVATTRQVPAIEEPVQHVNLVQHADEQPARYGRGLHWPGAFIERAFDAARSVHSRDLLVTVITALEAALPDVESVNELLAASAQRPEAPKRLRRTPATPPAAQQVAAP